MSIPLDRLYQHINDMAKQIFSKTVTLYRFYPHGSKKIEDLQALTELTLEEFFISPEIYCNDQEPLNYDLYATGPAMHLPPAKVSQALKSKGIEFPRLNFRGNVITIWDQAILLHSEKRSVDLERYQATQFIPVYYWVHAILALDWFRYAQHIEQHKQVSKTFLIYNRAWGGSREYRLRFAELVVQYNLQDRCLTSLNAVEPDTGMHYKSHKFKNPAWQPKIMLENFFANNTSRSHYSADFAIEDYQATDIEVVLETLFDDARLHLTEKILRPIACGQPFILVGTHGSLEYLRSYGFQTFGDVWNEEYDLIENPQQRLTHIVDLMQQIADWTPEIRKDKLAQAQQIADHNRQHFFSKDFFDRVYNELHTNLTSALTQLENNNTASGYLHLRTVYHSDPELYQLVKDFKKDETRKKMLELAQWYNNRNGKLCKNK